MAIAKTAGSLSYSILRALSLAMLTKLKEDAGLREKLQGAADLEAAVSLAQNAGFDLSRADWFRYQARQTLELSDEELEGVAGVACMKMCLMLRTAVAASATLVSLSSSTAMSEEQLTALLAKLKEDAGLREKFQDAADLDAALVIAKEAGFDVSRADWLQYQSKQTPELSDEELEGLAGGTSASLFIVDCVIIAATAGADWCN